MIYADERYIADSEHYQYKGMKIYLTRELFEDNGIDYDRVKDYVTISNSSDIYPAMKNYVDTLVKKFWKQDIVFRRAGSRGDMLTYKILERI
jgi:predicted HAD superfamily Cof-like phosphohydrolase